MDAISRISGTGSLVSALSSAAGAVPGSPVDSLTQEVSVRILKKALDAMQANEAQLLQLLDGPKALGYSFSPGRGVQVNSAPPPRAVDLTA